MNTWVCLSVATYLPIASDSKVLDDSQEEKKRDDPGTVVNVLYSWPEMYYLVAY